MTSYKRYPNYWDSGVEWIGEVPEGWSLLRLANAGNLVKANGGNKQDDSDDGVPCIRYGDLYTTYDLLIRNIKKFINPEVETDYTTIQYGDILFAASGETFEEIGKSAVNLTEIHACCGGDVVVLRPKKNIDPVFLGYATGSSSAQAQKTLMGKGFTVIHIYGDQLRNLVISAPPEHEQQLIGAEVDRETARIDAIIAKKTRFIDLLKEKRSALITHAVTKGINPNVKMKDSGVEWTGEVPEHWELRKIAHAFECIGSGTTPPSDQDKWYSDGEIPWITTGELRETVITETSKCVTTKALEEFSTLRLYPAGSLAMAMYGATIGRLGILGVPATTNQACCVLSGEISLSIQYAYFWLLAFKQQIIDLYAAGGGQPNINQEVIAFLRVPAPNLVEQATITAFLDRETARIDLLTQKTQHSIDLLKERRSALITAAVTGQIDLREQA